MPLTKNHSKNDELTEERVLQDICAFFRQRGCDTGFSEMERQWLLSYPDCTVRIAFAGQTNAGKSTLLNAMLDEELLASSTLQCSSEIISIGYGERYESCIQFADGAAPRTETHESAKQLGKAIQRHISISDSYRNIPHTLIDHDILSGQANADADGYIQRLAQRSGTMLLNEVAAIKSYIEARNKSDIPLSISITSPRFPYRELIFLDSPGFNAVGGLHKKNTELFARADIVVLVHSLVAPIEHIELHNLVQRALESHKPQDIVLVLTQACRLPSLEMLSKLHNAKRAYGALVCKENILAVDSLAFLTMNDLRRANGPKKLMRGYKKAIKALESMNCSTRKNEAHELKQRLSLLREFEEAGNSPEISKRLFKASGMDFLFSMLWRIDASVTVRTYNQVKKLLAKDARRSRSNSLLALYESEENRKYEELADLMSKNEKVRASLPLRCKNIIAKLKRSLDDPLSRGVPTLFSRVRMLLNELSENVEQFRASIDQTQAGISKCENSEHATVIHSAAYKKISDKATEMCSLRHREAASMAGLISDAMPASYFYLKFIESMFPNKLLVKKPMNIRELLVWYFLISIALVFLTNAYAGVVIGAILTAPIIMLLHTIKLLNNSISSIEELLASNINCKNTVPLILQPFVDQKNILQRLNEY